jgi:hypothetical protein
VLTPVLLLTGLRGAWLACLLPLLGGLLAFSLPERRRLV